MSLDYRSIVAEESARFLEILRAGPLDAIVPGCPEWTMADLALHMAGVQRWAAHILTVGVAEDAPGPPPDPSAPADAVAAATAELLAVLDTADPDEPCWNFTSGPQRKSFWFRRQALEIAVHRWDAESAVLPDPAPMTTAVGADVVDEFIHLVLGRAIDSGDIDRSALRGDVHLHCTDVADSDIAGEWTFELVDGELVIVDEHRKSTVAVRGTASDLALFVYGRIGVEGVETFGDAEVLAAWSPAFSR